MDILKTVVIDFRDDFVQEFMECSMQDENKLIIKNIISPSIDLIFYKDLLDTLPIDTFCLSMDYNHFSFVFLFQLKSQDILGKERNLELFDRLVFSAAKVINLKFSFEQSNYNLKFEDFPFETDFFFKEERVVWMPFEINTEDGVIDAILVFSSEEILKLGTIKLVA